MPVEELISKTVASQFPQSYKQRINNNNNNNTNNNTNSLVDRLRVSDLLKTFSSYMNRQCETNFTADWLL
jgi:hypothetical protein